MSAPVLAASDIATLEQAAWQAWPALAPQEDLCGWQLRFADGYTKRANSANSTAQSQALDGDLLQALEQRFAQRGLAPVFRLVQGAVPAGADDFLAAHGYRLQDPSLVLVRDFHAADTAQPAPEQADGAAQWLQSFVAVSGKALAGQDTHLAMLGAIAAPCCYAHTLGPEQGNGHGQAQACALGVLAQGQLGLFDIATHAVQRGRGLATDVVQRVLGWGARQGAQRAYLQVLASNTTALRLYARLGFRQAYRYWYRVPG